MTRPTPLPVHVEGIPLALRTERRWVVWRYQPREGKWTKVPYIATATSSEAKSTDPSTWRLFDEALAAYEDGKCDGVGFMLGDGWVGFDVDHTDAPEYVQLLNSYTERSVGGGGIHVICRGAKPGTRCRIGPYELYDAGRYFTITGHRIEGTPPTVEERTVELAALYAQLFPNGTPKTTEASTTTLDDDEVLTRASAAKNGEKFKALYAGDITGYTSHSEADAALCMLFAFWTNKNATQMDRLFRGSKLMREKWDEDHGGSTYGATTIRNAINLCKTGYAGELILKPDAPLVSAEAFVAREYTTNNIAALRHQAGVFYTYQHSAGAYLERDEPAVRADLYRFLKQAKQSTKTGLAPFDPNKSKVENVLDALRGIANLPKSMLPPRWLTGGHGWDPLDMLAFPNGLLHIPTRTLYPPTAEFFTLNGLDFAYDPHAPAPVEWLAFLKLLWKDDPESMGTLQELLGYFLTPDTSQQKVPMLVGPKRSGKGLIGRTARRLVGERNACSPTLAAFDDTFGKQVLIGKTLAVISDARISGRTDTAKVAETLLSISGEDPQTIPRKFLVDWTGSLYVRFLILTNELPRITDASGALASRFILLALTESFYGREDPGLFHRFVPELPGILNWALDGRGRLNARGYFVQPTSANELIQEFNDLGSAEATFLRQCTQTKAGAAVRQKDLFDQWAIWCKDNGRDKPGTLQSFSRNVRAVLPWVTVRQLGGHDDRERYWVGLELTAGSAM